MSSSAGSEKTSHNGSKNIDVPPWAGRPAPGRPRVPHPLHLAPPCRNGVGAAQELRLSRAGARHGRVRRRSYRRPIRSSYPSLHAQLATLIRPMLLNRVTAAEALQAVLDALQGAAPLEAVLDTLLRQARAFLAADEAYLMQFDDLLHEGKRLVVRAAVGMPDGAIGRSIAATAGLEGAAATAGAAVAVADAGADPRFVDPFGRAAPPGALLAVPMLVRGQATGVVVVARRTPGRFDEPAGWWLERLAGLAAVAVAQ